MIKNYDIIHFEALGEEARHLVDETNPTEPPGIFKAESTGGTARYHQY